MPKVSVCVPVYNVELYIERCIRSIQEQTLKDIEIIVVNDSTPDKSMEVVEQIAKTDSRIKVISHDRNHGLMWARRTGYMAATGDYITFCDSDDTLPSNSVEILYDEAIKTGADICSGNITYIDTKGHQSIWESSLKYGEDKIGIYKSLLKKECGHNVCSKLFKRELLQNFEYTTYDHFINGEDGCLFYQVVENCQKMVHINVSVYNYLQNTESSSQTRFSAAGIHSVILLNKMREEKCSKYMNLRTDLFKCISTILNQLYAFGYNKDKTLESEIAKLELNKYLSIKKMLKVFSLKDFSKLIILHYIKPLL